MNTLLLRQVAIDTYKENVAYLHRDCKLYRSEGFQALTGDSVQATQPSFARMNSTLANPGGDPGTEDDGSDEILETFTLSGASAGSLEDTAIASALPRANWSTASNEGVLAASFDFDGTGGPGGDFDWYIRTGETIFLNTSGDQIVGGPNGEPFFTQPVFNGVVDVNDLVVEAGGRLVIQGPNTCTILATGNVTIRGEVSLDGGDNAGVGTLNTTNQPEEGAEGQAGGGAGGGRRVGAQGRWVARWRPGGERIAAQGSTAAAAVSPCLAFEASRGSEPESPARSG